MRVWGQVSEKESHWNRTVPARGEEGLDQERDRGNGGEDAKSKHI